MTQKDAAKELEEELKKRDQILQVKEQLLARRQALEMKSLRASVDIKGLYLTILLSFCMSALSLSHPGNHLDDRL